MSIHVDIFPYDFHVMSIYTSILSPFFKSYEIRHIFLRQDVADAIVDLGVASDEQVEDWNQLVGGGQLEVLNWTPMD